MKTELKGGVLEVWSVMTYGWVPSSGVKRHKSPSQSFRSLEKMCKSEKPLVIVLEGLELGIVAQKQEIVGETGCG